MRSWIFLALLRRTVHVSVCRGRSGPEYLGRACNAVCPGCNSYEDLFRKRNRLTYGPALLRCLLVDYFGRETYTFHIQTRETVEQIVGMIYETHQDPMS